MLDLAIIGAGPYGISIAAHAKKAGINYNVFGYPMDFWATKMPPDMFIRTSLYYTNFSDPDNKYTLKRFANEKNMELTYPLPRSVFVDYGLWFIKKNHVLVSKTLITKLVKYNDDVFELQTEEGTFYKAKNVIVAVGLTGSEYIPDNFYAFPKKLISHTSNYTNFHEFKNQHVLVLGGGQSAWETSALLHKAEAKVDLVYRRPQRLNPERNMNAKQHELADEFYYLSKQKQVEIRRKFEKPTVAEFLVSLVEGKVRQRANTFITQVKKTKNNKLKVTFNDQNILFVDHVILATGYRYSPNNINFLKTMINDIDVCESGEPVINENFESSVSNLFFAGPATAYSHGPTFRFIAGVRRTSEVLVNHIMEQK